MPKQARELLETIESAPDDALRAYAWPPEYCDLTQLKDGRVLEVHWSESDAGGKREIAFAWLYPSRDVLVQAIERERDGDKALLEWERQSWDDERGIPPWTDNNQVVLIRAGVEEVAAVLSRELRAVRWERDALDREIVTAGIGLFVFRLRGHIWTQVVDQAVFSEGTGRLDEILPTVSRVLSARLIDYGMSDTVGALDYRLYKAGELVETFSLGDEGTRFESRLRAAGEIELYDPHAFVDAFFRRQEALAPGITGDYFFGYELPRPGERTVVRNPGITLQSHLGSRTSIPAFERVDYLALD